MKIAAALLISLFFVFPVQAQEAASTANSTTQGKTYSRTIIVQTDSEESVANQAVLCRQTPKKLGLIAADEVVVHEITTNESGAALLEFTDIPSSMFICSSKEITTADYCWYFPHSTISFEIYEESEKNKPVYLVGQTSPDTCNKELTQEELENGISTLLPQGTALPFTNKNLMPATPAPEAMVENIETDNQEITLWQWIVQKLRTLFR